MKRGTYRPSNHLPDFTYDGGYGPDGLRNAITQMMRDPARVAKPRPIKHEPHPRRCRPSHKQMVRIGRFRARLAEDPAAVY